MTTNEIIQTLAARLQITQREARLHLRHLLAAISDRLQKGETVGLPGLGGLNAAPAKPRRTFDAATQEFVPLPAKVEFFFKPYKRLKARLEKWRAT
jgi:nucleoid DNA-binding protein